MSILIKDMEMPTRCVECRLSTVHSFNDRPLCDVLVKYMSYGEWETKRLDDCPLIEVQPHGRLIDADAVERNLVKMQMAQKGVVGHGIRKSRAVVRDMATIIPADNDSN